MAYGLKLYYEWTSFTGIHNKVEIRDKDKADDTGAVKGTALGYCFAVEYPKKKLGYDVIRSCGAKLSFEYKGVEGFLDDFFTPDLKRFKVIHYQENNVNFLGYLNTELYSEDYQKNTENGVDVELTANNGLAITDRLNYLQPNGDYYNGIDNIKTVFQRIFDSVGLEYQNLYITPLFDLVIDDVGTLSSDYLTDEYINNANWIDEDFEASSLRDILENILVGNGLQLITVEDDIYILPIEAQAKASTTTSFYHYTLPTFTKQSNKTIDLSPLEIMDIGYDAGGGQSKSKVSAINSQEIEYDPYSIDDDVINGEIDKDDLFLTKTGEGSFGSGDYAWTKEYYLEHSNFIKNQYDNKSTEFVKAYKTNEPKSHKNYIEVESENVSIQQQFKWAVESKPIPLYIINGSQLKINLEIWLQTKDNWEGDSEDESGSPLQFMMLDAGAEIYIRSGNYAYNKDTKKFDTYFDPTVGIMPGTINRECCIFAYDPSVSWSPSPIFDQKLSPEVIVDFTYDEGITIDNNIVVGIGHRRNGYVPVDYMRVYDVKVSIYDSVADAYGVDLSSLVKSSELELDPLFKDKGKKIKTSVGTLLQQPDFKVSNLNQRGAFLYTNDNVSYTPITSFKKGGVTNVSEYWVLNQIITNYTSPSNVLKCNLNTYNLLRPVKDTPYLGAIKMIATGGVYDYYNDTFSTVLQEIKPMV